MPKAEIETHSANMHMIPANDEIERHSNRFAPATWFISRDISSEATGKDGFRWKSSLTRSDTGGGACELILVESLFFW
jgi:hypothetical protein